MELQQGRRVKDGSKNYKLNDKKNSDSIATNILVIGKKRWIWFWYVELMICDGHIQEDSEMGVGRQFRPLETSGCRSLGQWTWKICSWVASSDGSSAHDTLNEKKCPIGCAFVVWRAWTVPIPLPPSLKKPHLIPFYTHICCLPG